MDSFNLHLLWGSGDTAYAGRAREKGFGGGNGSTDSLWNRLTIPRKKGIPDKSEGGPGRKG